MNTHTKKLVVKESLAAAAFLVAFASPRFAYAQNNISNLIDSFTGIVNQLIPLVASLALLAFFWGLAKYIFNAGSDEAQQQGKRIMVGGIIALFLIASVGGIIDFIANAFDIDTGESIDPPEIMYNGGDGIG